MTFILLVALLIPRPRVIASTAADARLSRIFVAGGERACALGAGRVPGLEWLHGRFVVAERRLHWDPRHS
jgi:hypothetical protein